MPVWNTRLLKPPHHLVSFPNPLALESEAENLSTHLYTSWKILIMASQAHCNQMQILQQGLTNKKWFEIARKKSNIGISGDFNAILRRFLWRLPRADNSYEKKRAILWGLPMNSMHRWCKRKRLKSGGGTAILCKEDSSSNIFRACTFGWLDSNQPKPTQHWTCNMIFLAQPLAPSKTPKARCRQSSSPIHICLVLDGFLRFISYPLLQPSYVFHLLSLKIGLMLFVVLGFLF